MSALDELLTKEDMTKLERVVHLVYGWDESLNEIAEAAAAELAALRRVAEAARAFFPKNPMESNEYWIVRKEIKDALAEYDKCRAA